MAEKKDSNLKDSVEKALGKIRPMLQGDGGDVELVDVSKDGVVKVKLTGACHGCPMAQMTLANGVEKIIRKDVPEIKNNAISQTKAGLTKVILDGQQRLTTLYLIIYILYIYIVYIIYVGF